jgi:hypothetical protein
MSGIRSGRHVTKVHGIHVRRCSVSFLLCWFADVCMLVCGHFEFPGTTACEGSCKKRLFVHGSLCPFYTTTCQPYMRAQYVYSEEFHFDQEARIDSPLGAPRDAKVVCKCISMLQMRLVESACRNMPSRLRAMHFTLSKCSLCSTGM